jgi:XTP/dITP diphosphohydrolase
MIDQILLILNLLYNYWCKMLKSNTNTLIVATNNAHKAQEFAEVLGSDWKVYTAKDIGNIDWKENGATFLENSKIKAVAVSHRLPEKYKHAIVIADDSGLCVDALDGAPGIYSSRFAGASASDQENNTLLLEKLTGKSSTERSAHFVCALTIYQNGTLINTIEGKFHGRVSDTLSGEGGFGYDPLFIPDGYDKAVATFSPELKNKISHRGQALAKFKEWVESQI